MEVDHNKIRCDGQTSLTPPLTLCTIRPLQYRSSVGPWSQSVLCSRSEVVRPSVPTMRVPSRRRDSKLRTVGNAALSRPLRPPCRCPISFNRRLCQFCPPSPLLSIQEEVPLTTLLRLRFSTGCHHETTHLTDHEVHLRSEEERMCRRTATPLPNMNSSMMGKLCLIISTHPQF